MARNLDLVITEAEGTPSWNWQQMRYSASPSMSSLSSPASYTTSTSPPSPAPSSQKGQIKLQHEQQLLDHRREILAKGEGDITRPHLHLETGHDAGYKTGFEFGRRKAVPVTYQMHITALEEIHRWARTIRGRCERLGEHTSSLQLFKNTTANWYPRYGFVRNGRGLALQYNVLLGALEMQDEILGSTVDVNPRQPYALEHCPIRALIWTASKDRKSMPMSTPGFHFGGSSTESAVEHRIRAFKAQAEAVMKAVALGIDQRTTRGNIQNVRIPDDTAGNLEGQVTLLDIQGLRARMPAKVDIGPPEGTKNFFAGRPSSRHGYSVQRTWYALAMFTSQEKAQKVVDLSMEG
ncbi:hypothetical protein C8A03DRAFT_37857 [Achaetomium macrosporum]|uniref:Uncharacterized protein n=1 Tax=Achaetomium macrosporum TaxID=79813 RepID=A0AAN7C3H0_9PEZI|nr:hypothetical protein C8A03DRAFT_37857 [Achaetomium macrosporum]